ncbi:MAG: homoserine dehydrogenase [Planctomycetota bacterium]|nr:homoserine dehydrogenase [Planctomycetota bacterium]
MPGMRRCGVGLVGAGTVGGGVAETLLTRGDLLARRSGVDVDLAMAADQDVARALAAGVPAGRVVDDYRKVVVNPGVDIVVELMGGVGTAHEVVMAALDAGKHVVTANKALLAERGADIFRKAREKKLVVAFEAAVAGGIPLLLALREGLIANRVRSLLGIVNGTSNYILTAMTEKSLPFATALQEAQRLGFAEADPSADIDGKDSGHKLSLLSALAFDTWIDFSQLHIEGIRGIQDADIRIASYLGYVPKLLGVIRAEPGPGAAGDDDGGEAADGARLFLSVHPALLRATHPLAGVSGSLNAVETESDLALESMFYGRGAGRFPTASAVVADIVAVAKSVAFGGPGPAWLPPERNACRVAPFDDYRARHYLRFIVRDVPGVLGTLATALGAKDVSIAAMHQFEAERSDGYASVCLVTHNAREGNVAQALRDISALELLHEPPVLIRIEG